ncbi:MAG: hypothetical protein VXZ96_04965 [Myxococcota bacterium]|nr:hypothetical protein [Myxococcota bacterium]MEC8379646.1 hypothetical protein [Myxococcota bacterium]
MHIPFVVLMGVGCRKPVVEVPKVEVENVSSVQPKELIKSLAGQIEEGKFQDFKHDIEIPISDEWGAEIGDSNAALRLRLLHQSKAVSIEYWMFDGIYEAPIPSERCSWSFTDIGHYSRFSFTRTTTVASCEYNEQSQLVFAIIIPMMEQTWQIEVHTEPAFLLQNLETAYSHIQKISILNDELSNMSSSESSTE